MEPRIPPARVRLCFSTFVQPDRGGGCQLARVSCFWAHSRYGYFAACARRLRTAYWLFPDPGSWRDARTLERGKTIGIARWALRLDLPVHRGRRSGVLAFS